MTNLLSTIRKIAAIAVLAASIAAVPQFTGVAKVQHASASLCGYTLVASSGIYNGYFQEVGYLRLWKNECNSAMHTQTVSEIGSQNLLAAVTINGTNHGTVTWYGGNLNTAEQLNPVLAAYRGYGCVAGICTSTPTVYS